MLKGEADDLAAVRSVIAEAQPDVLVIAGFDYDHGLAALTAFRDTLAAEGLRFPHLHAVRPNSGRTTEFDLDGDGWRRGARDAQGFGSFAGQGGLALMSRLPLTGTQDFSGFLWRDLPGALLRRSDPGWETQRLSSVAHLVLTLDAPGGEPLSLLTYHATPPVFDGPEDRNGRRNHDETAFWAHYLAGTFGDAPGSRFVLLGDANLDPLDGDGRNAALAALLEHPRLQDPEPESDTARAAAGAEGGANADHRGDPALDTANWRDGEGDPGNLRVDYVLPSADWEILDTGVTWGRGETAPRHGLVWVDLAASD